MLDRLIGGITGGITGGIGGLVGGVSQGLRDGYSHKDRRSSGYGYEEHREFVSHVQTEGGYSDRQARYKHHKRLPANHARRPMAQNMLPDSDVEEFFESSRTHQTTALPHHSYNHHNVKMGNGWQGQHEDAYHGGYGMMHQDRFMAPQVPTRHVYMNPIHDGHHKHKDRE